MTKNAKKILIETEQSETVVLRLIGKGSITAFCEACGGEATMVDLSSAVNYTGRTARVLIGEIESGAIHSTETASGHLLVCEASLVKLGSLSKSAVGKIKR